MTEKGSVTEIVIYRTQESKTIIILDLLKDTAIDISLD
jgi:hypothetical protein